MDLLSRVLSSLTIESTSISRWQLFAPWGVEVSNFAPGYCLSVVEGECWVSYHHQAPQRLQAGDTLLVPRGGDCTLVSEPEVSPTPIDQLPWQGDPFEGLDAMHRPSSAQQVSLGKPGGIPCRLLGLAFTFRHSSSDFLLRSLPTYLQLRANDSPLFTLTRPAIESLIDDTQPGYIAVASQLADLIIVSVIRAAILSDQIKSQGWLKGFQDRQLQAVLAAIHTRPQTDWSVTALAKAANMSRSSLAERFKTAVGIPPMEYLNRWRIQLACDLLRETQLPVGHIAEQVGYGSDRVMRRLFASLIGMSPLAYRKQYRLPTQH